MKRIFLFLLVLLLLPLPVIAKHLHKEADYQQVWCNAHNGVMEYELPDKARVDCMATIDGIDYAIEFDFSTGAKVYECVGQALYYALMTERQPGAVLIVENLKDYWYLNRFIKIADKYKIKYWIMTAEDYENAVKSGK